MPKWIIEFSAEIGIIVMTFVAGTAAYLKAWEAAEETWEPKRHIIQLLMKQFYAAFAAMMVWYAIQAVESFGFNVPEPAVPLIIGLAAYNGVRVVEFMTTTSFDLIRSRLGLDKKETSKDEPKRPL